MNQWIHVFFKWVIEIFGLFTVSYSEIANIPRCAVGFYNRTPWWAANFQRGAPFRVPNMNLSRRIEMMSFNSFFKMLEIIILIIVPPSFHYFLYPIHPMGFHSMASVVGWGLALWQIRANITCPKTASGWFCACRDPSHGRTWRGELNNCWTNYDQVWIWNEYDDTINEV